MPLSDRSLFASARSLLLAGLGAVASIAGSAHATWSILIADMQTGEIVIGSATCVELIDLQRNTPLIISGIGAVTAQSVVDTSGTNRQIIRDRLLQGVPLGAILDELAMTDPGHNNRQYGFITAGGESLTYSGIQNAAWAGGMTGRIERGQPGLADDIVYSVQGNILSGGNVVQAAVDAIRASDGDLPQMMMEAMQAAKTAGGDGRCSCSPANPTGCGSPPPEPFKSAHVGYMLGTRAGDLSSARAIYPTDFPIGGMALIDLDGDGLNEVILGDGASDQLVVYQNTATPGDPLSHLQLSHTLIAPASQAVAMGTGDFDNDGIDELAVVHSNPPRLTIYQNNGNGTITGPVSIDLPGIPVSMAIGALTPAGDAIAVAIEHPQEVRFYGSKDGSYQQLGSLALGYAPAGIEIAELVGGGAPDLAVADFNNDTVFVYEHDGAMGFASPMSIATLAQPLNLRSADMNLDGTNELLVQTDAGRAVQVFALDAGVWNQWGSAVTFRDGLGFAVGPMNPGDDFPDIVTTSAFSNRNLRLQISDGMGGFTQQSFVRAGSGARSVLLSDMNGNGDLDIVIGNGGSEGLMILDNPGDGNLPQPGQFAEGDYFLSLNVPNQRSGDPDPVDQLQALYDDWLLTREGRVDAVNSRVMGRQRIAIGSGTTLTIELRDLRGELLAISDPDQLRTQQTDLLSVGDPVNIAPGVFELMLTAGGTIGRGTLTVLAGDQGDPVELMPSVELFVVEQAADMNADGRCTFADVSLFISAFISGSPDADFNDDQMINFMDVSAFIDSYMACTGG